MEIRAHVLISGRVQGVFFRSETRKMARKHGVTGWVRNLHDGRVEAVFEGDDRNVKRLIGFCKQGPPGAHVTKADVSFEGYKGSFKDFRVTW